MMSENYKTIGKMQEAILDLRSKGWTINQIHQRSGFSHTFLMKILEEDPVGIKITGVSMEKMNAFLFNYHTKGVRKPPRKKPGPKKEESDFNTKVPPSMIDAIPPSNLPSTEESDEKEAQEVESSVMVDTDKVDTDTTRGEEYFEENKKLANFIEENRVDLLDELNVLVEKFNSKGYKLDSVISRIAVFLILFICMTIPANSQDLDTTYMIGLINNGNVIFDSVVFGSDVENSYKMMGDLRLKSDSILLNFRRFRIERWKHLSYVVDSITVEDPEMVFWLQREFDDGPTKATVVKDDFAFFLFIFFDDMIFHFNGKVY